MRKCFLILTLLLLIASCKKADAPAEYGFNLYFETPQPINDSYFSKMPNKFIGLFMDTDSNYVNIKENVVLKESYYRFKFHKNMLDSLKTEFDLADSHYVSKLNKDIYDYRYIGDSIEFSNKQIDTFFIFSNTEKAKRFNGQLVLNYKDSIFWKVRSLRLEKNILKITYLYSKEDLKRMDSITKIKSRAIDTASFISKPSRNEFKKILNLKNIGYERNYNRVLK
jgi:hypothetical protein